MAEAPKQMIGYMESYVRGENFEDYLERLENYFDLNDTGNEKKVLLLSNLIGPDASSKLSKVCKPKKIKEYSYEEVVVKCRELFVPKYTSCVTVVKFNQLTQRQGESITDFAMELITLAQDCQFGEYKDTALRNQFICGVLDRKLKAQLMAVDEKSSFKQVVEKAVAAELIHRDMGSVSGELSSTTVNRLEREERKENNVRRSRYDYKSTDRSSKPVQYTSSYGNQHRSKSGHRRVECFRCHGIGHYARDCRSGYRNKFYNVECGDRFSRYSSDSHQQRNKNPDVRDPKINSVDDGVTVGLGNLSLYDNALDNVTVDAGGGDYNYNNEAYSAFSNVVYDDSEGMSLNSVDRDILMTRTKSLNPSDVVVRNVEERFQVTKVECISIIVENKPFKMEVDTGACVSLCSLEDYKREFSHLKIEKIDLPLSVLTGDRIRMVGKIKVDVKTRVNEKSNRLDMVVVDTPKQILALCGRDWLDILFSDWRGWFQINKVNLCQGFREKIMPQIFNEFSMLFDGDLKTPIKDFIINIPLNERVTPVFHKAYQLPFSLRDKVEKELERMVGEGIIEGIKVSEWASPIVVVPKGDGSIRICVDCSVTLNRYVKTQFYPLPVIDEVLASLAGSKFFCSLDLKGAYAQLLLSEEARQLVTINTHKGLFVYKRLPYGLKPAAGIFQGVMDQILNGLPNTFCYIDDILIGAETLEELQKRLILVLKQLEKYNVKVNYSKCKFFVEEITYLGHEISAAGIGPSKDKVRAIVEAPSPRDVTGLKSFIGLLNYYSKFLPKLNQKCGVFYNLLKKGEKWEWNEECQKVFEECKKDMLSSSILELYDSRKEIVVVCDASNSGLSGILCHRVNNEEKPVFFVSRTLTTAEKNYPIIHREALAIVYAMEKFFKYVYGHHVTIFTDHKPLVGIYSRKSSAGQASVVATRLQRYINRMAVFDYSIKYRKGRDNGNADCLSRLSIEDKEINEEDWLEQQSGRIDLIGEDGGVTLDIKLVKEETDKDQFISKLKYFIINGWNGSGIDKTYKNYYSKNNALSVEEGCVMYGNRVIIPKSIRELVLGLLHRNHSGIVRMKVMARKYVYWESIDKEIESYVKKCETCQLTSNDKPKKLYSSWKQEESPFDRVHIDFFYFEGKEFLILIDAYSRWIEVILMNGTNAQKVIEKLETVFRIFGLPKTVVSDNGPPFKSSEFENWCKSRGINLVHTPPYHPASNGQVERAVQTTKSVLKKFVVDSCRMNVRFDLRRALEIFLKNYNHLPCTEENFVPSERLFSYQPRTILDAIKLGNQKHQEVANNDALLKDRKEKSVRFDESKNIIFEHVNSGGKDKNVKLDQFCKGDRVLYWNANKNGYEKWVTAKIIERKSKVVYQILLLDNIVKLAHVNQLRRSWLQNNGIGRKFDSIYQHEGDRKSITRDEQVNKDDKNVNSRCMDDNKEIANRFETRTQRVRRLPKRFDDFICNQIRSDFKE